MVIVFPFSCQLQLKLLILRMDVKLEKGKVQCVFNPRAPTKLLEREQVGGLVEILVAVRGSKPVGRAAAATCRYLCPASLHFTAGATPHLAPASKNPFLCEHFVPAEIYGYDSEQCIDVMLLARSFLLERLSLLMPEWCLRSAIGPQPLVVSLQIICTGHSDLLQILCLLSTGLTSVIAADLTLILKHLRQWVKYIVKGSKA